MATLLPISPPSVTVNAFPSFLNPPSLHPTAALPFIKWGRRTTAGRVQASEFSTSFFDNDDWYPDFEDEEEEDEDEDIFFEAHDPEKENIPCPPGLRKYESVVILRPNLSEDECVATVQKYEELLVAGGGMYVEIYNKGVFPLDYGIKKKDRDGVASTYWDGIYIMFTYFTNPTSIEDFESTLRKADNVIRVTTFEERKKRTGRPSKKQMEKEKNWEIERARRKLEASTS